MTALAAIRARHVQRFPPPKGWTGYCDADDQPWPCDTAIVLAALDAALRSVEPLEVELHAAVDDRDAALARERRLREAADDLYSIAKGEHGHDETHSADWPSCLPAHIAMNRYRAALAETLDA